MIDGKGSMKGVREAIAVANISFVVDAFGLLRVLGRFLDGGGR